MKNEALRRMKLFGLSDSYISAFEEKGKIPCFDSNGNPIELTEEMQKDIEKLSERGDCIYLATVSNYVTDYGVVVMHNYFYVSYYKEDWDYECSKCADGLFSVNAAVKSELTGGCFDYGAVYLQTKDRVRRLSFPEAAVYTNSFSME